MIEFIEKNLIFNKKKECWAFFEMIPYNYSFLSLSQKEAIHESFEAMVNGVKTTKIKMLKLATERSLKVVVEESKRYVRSEGKLKEITHELLDRQLEIFETEGAERQIDYRFFLGFKLTISTEKLTVNNFINEVKNTFLDFFYSVNHELFGEFMMKPEADLKRYLKTATFLEKKISNRIDIRPLTKDDIGYIVNHINFKTDNLFDDYVYYLPRVVENGRIILKKYDLVKLNRVLIEPHGRYVKITSDDETVYVTYLAIEDIKEDVLFGQSELLYFEQSLDFAIDTSIEIEKILYKKALTTIVNKRKEIKDQEKHIYESDADVSNALTDSLDAISELEDEVKGNKEAMYKVNFLTRVSAKTKEELENRTEMLIDFYSDYEITLVRPYGDMEKFHQEFMPSNGRATNDYVHQMRSESIASFGFGATTQLGERSGIFIGWNNETGQPVYIRPEIAAQGKKGTTTSSPAMTMSGAKGGGKSMAFNTLIDWIVKFGGKAILFDPKNERTHWRDAYPFIGEYVDVIDVTSDETNAGMFDPFLIVPDEIKADGMKINAESLALDIATFLTGISIKDDKRFVPLRKAVRIVGSMKERGMLKIIDVLRGFDTEIALQIADHLEVFTDYDFAKLLFSNGKTKNTLNLTKPLNVIQIADLVLPNKKGKANEKEKDDPLEILSVAIMIAISTFSISFAYSNRSIFKVLGLEEAWAMTAFPKGELLIQKTVRMGRALNLGSFFATQQTNDVGGSDIKNNIGMKFAFRSTDEKEIKEILKYFKLDEKDVENQKIIEKLDVGECLFKDLYGRIGVVYIDTLFPELFDCFDTRPPMLNENRE